MNRRHDWSAGMNDAPAAGSKAPLQVIVVSGHMTDLPDRTTTRFPESLAPEVSDAIDATLRDWGVDHRSVLLCGGARGSDLIAGESALALGARVQLCLALPEPEFVERSVDSPGTDWVARFEAVRDRSVVRVLQRDQGAPSDNVFEATNKWMLGDRQRVGTPRSSAGGVGPTTRGRARRYRVLRRVSVRDGRRSRDHPARAVDRVSRAFRELRSSLVGIATLRPYRQS